MSRGLPRLEILYTKTVNVKIYLPDVSSTGGKTPELSTYLLTLRLNFRNFIPGLYYYVIAVGGPWH